MNEASVRQWLSGICEESEACPWTVTALHGAGSLRKFWRASCDKHQLVVGWSPSEAEHQRIVDLGRRLEAIDIPVARYVGEDSAQGIVAHEDAGSMSFHRMVHGTAGPAGTVNPAPDHGRWKGKPISTEALDVYRQALDALAVLGTASRSCVDGYPAFGHEDLRWETWYGLTHQVGGRLGIHRPSRGLEDELESVAGAVLDGPFAPMHRDFQSTNLHWNPTSEKITILDWGGARWGPAFYDLVSLLWDPYVDMHEADRAELLDHWANCGAPRVSGQVLAATALQRLLQAAGAYAFLSRHYARPVFEAYSTAALRSAVDAAGPWPRLKDHLAEALDVSRKTP